MIINDAEGKYTLQVDKERRVVYDVKTGPWKMNDYERFHEDYKTKVIPYLGTGSWTKIDDYENYVPSTHVNADTIGLFVQWVYDNGLKRAALVSASATARIQIKRALQNVDIDVKYFDNKKDAEDWLNIRE